MEETNDAAHPPLVSYRRAVHEAGHAVVASALGASEIRVVLGEVVETGEQGNTSYQLDASGETPSGLQTSWMIIRAGGVATVFFYGPLGTRLPERILMDDCSDDDFRLERLVDQLSTADRDAWVRAAYLSTWSLVLTHRMAILRLAGTLASVPLGTQVWLSEANGFGSSFKQAAVADAHRARIVASALRAASWPSRAAYMDLIMAEAEALFAQATRSDPPGAQL